MADTLTPQKIREWDNGGIATRIAADLARKISSGILHRYADLPNDPDFLAEYRRGRESLEALSERMRKLTSEFGRRAGGKWASAS